MAKRPQFEDLQPPQDAAPQRDSSRGSFSELHVGSGSKSFHMDRDGFWLGAKKFVDAIFSVTMLGVVTAVAGYFGNAVNGVMIDSTGLTMLGTGFIRTAASGTRFVMTSTTFQGINSTGDVIFEIDLDGVTEGDVTIGDVISGQYAQWDDSAGELIVYGVVRALSGYFGSLLNGVLIDSTGLTLQGTGYIRTASSGTRFVTTPTTFQGINATGDVIFEILLDGANIGDVTMGKVASGSYAQWDDSASAFLVAGEIRATSGFFGTLLNGVLVDSTGLTLQGTGYIRTASSGTRFVMTPTTFQGINSAGDVIFEIELSGADAGDVTIGDVLSQYAQWDDSAGEFIINGVLRASSGYFGGVTNGVLIDSSGLTIQGSGYIRTGSSGERIVMERATATAYHSLLFYDSSDVQKMRLSANGIYQNRTDSDTNDGAKFEGGGTGDFFSAVISGTASRENDAGYRFENSAAHGNGLNMVNSSNSWDGDFITQDNSGTSKKNMLLRILGQATSAISHESVITADGVMFFPAYHHRSEFDETPAALAATVIANAFWTGGGTGGTQAIETEGAEFSDDEYTYLSLSTGAVAGQTSTATFNRSTRNGSSRSRLEAMISFSSKTNTKWEWGWRADANNYAVFYFDTAVSTTQIYFKVVIGGSTVTDTAVASIGNVDTFHRFTIQMYNTLVYAWLDDTALSFSSSFSYFGTMKPYAYVDNKSAAEEKILRIDYVDIAHGRPMSP